MYASRVLRFSAAAAAAAKNLRKAPPTSPWQREMKEVMRTSGHYTGHPKLHPFFMPKRCSSTESRFKSLKEKYGWRFSSNFVDIKANADKALISASVATINSWWVAKAFAKAELMDFLRGALKGMESKANEYRFSLVVAMVFGAFLWVAKSFNWIERIEGTPGLGEIVKEVTRNPVMSMVFVRFVESVYAEVEALKKELSVLSRRTEIAEQKVDTMKAEHETFAAQIIEEYEGKISQLVERLDEFEQTIALLEDKVRKAAGDGGK